MIMERQDDMATCAQTWKNKCAKEKRQMNTHRKTRLLYTESQLVVSTEEDGGEIGEVDKVD